MKEKSFNLPEGVKIADRSGIAEGYEVIKASDNYSVIRINVSAEHIAPYFLELISVLEEPGFFVVELPVSKTEEQALRKKDSDPCHKRVFYLDGISKRQAEEFFEEYQELFINDGMINFGFGSLTHEEVYVGAYKVFEIFTAEPDKFSGVLQSLDLKKSDCLLTVREKIGADNPGERCSIEGEPCIHDMLGAVLDKGFYIADTRED